MQIENLRLYPTEVLPRCAPALFPLKSTMLTAAAAEEFFSYNDFHSCWLFLEAAFEVSPFSVNLATSQHSRTSTQATTDTHNYPSKHTKHKQIHAHRHFLRLYFSTVRRRESKRKTDWGGREEGGDAVSSSLSSLSSEATQDSVSPRQLYEGQWTAPNMTGVLMANSKQAAQREKMESLNFDPEAEKS